MAAPRIRCNHCGDPWERRAVNQFYCPKPDCQRAHTRERIRDYRLARAQLEQYARQAAITRGATEAAP